MGVTGGGREGNGQPLFFEPGGQTISPSPSRSEGVLSPNHLTPVFLNILDLKVSEKLSGDVSD